jgi:hypothetical protein
VSTNGTFAPDARGVGGGACRRPDDLSMATTMPSTTMSSNATIQPMRLRDAA